MRNTKTLILISLLFCFATLALTKSHFLEKKPLDCNTLPQQNQKKINKCHRKFSDPDSKDDLNACLKKAEKKNQDKIAKCEKLKAKAAPIVKPPVAQPPTQQPPQRQPQDPQQRGQKQGTPSQPGPHEGPQQGAPQQGGPQQGGPQGGPGPQQGGPGPQQRGPQQGVPGPQQDGPAPQQYQTCLEQVKAKYKQRLAKCEKMSNQDEKNDCIRSAKFQKEKEKLYCSPEGRFIQQRELCLAKAKRRKDKALTKCETGFLPVEVCRMQVKFSYNKDRAICIAGGDIYASKLVYSLFAALALLLVVFSY